MNILDAVSCLFSLATDQLNQADLGNGKALSSAGHYQGGNNGQGEGNLDLQQSALAAGALDVDGAADLLDVGFHHIHAYPASGDVADLLHSRQSGSEYQTQNLAFRH